MRKPDAAGDRTTVRAGTRPDPRAAAPPHLALTSTWSIQSKLIAVLAIPMVALVALWVVATWVTLAPGLALLDARDSAEAVGRPAQNLIAAIQAERRLAVGHLAADRPDDRALAEQYQRTDAAVAEFRARADTGDARSTLTPAGAARLDEFLLHLSTLATVRDDVDSASIGRSEALRHYTDVIEAGLALDRSLIRPSTEDLSREAQAIMALAEARELLARQDAVLTGAIEAGTLTADDLSQTVQLIGARRHQSALAVADLDATDRAAYSDLTRSESAATLAALEDRLIVEAQPGQPVPIDAGAWRAAYDEVSEGLRAFELDAADRLVERSQPEALFVFGRIAVTGAIGLIALVLSVIASQRVARSVLRRLAGLRQAALELAIDRIPRVVARLRAGERVDVAAEAPPLPYGSDEIGQVGHAFNALQREAVGAAVAEADLRRGVNEVFLNIARRSQTLLHRQLTVLDRMERRAEDPVELEDLFRVDHLATRMRRHAEDLVILAGAAPARGWRLPIPLVDVVRGAISEIEDYARVTVRPVPEVAVAGRAVGDVIHLLAELIENAASFSPPTTKVSIGAEPVTHGVAVEIEDRGIGIPPATLERLNSELADPPEFGELASRSGAHSGELASRSGAHSGELASRSGAANGAPASRTGTHDGTPASRTGNHDGDPANQSAENDPGAGGQLGLFVVARLAARHGIQVQLRRSAYGGTTAVVLLPDSVLAAPGEQPALPASPAGRSGPVATEPPTSGFVPLSSASPTAPRSAAESPQSAFTPAQAQGDPLPSRRRPAPGLEDAETGVIVATTGKPLGRHAEEDVIEPDDDDGLPRRVRRRDPDASGRSRGDLAEPAESLDTGQTTQRAEEPAATQADSSRSPEQIRAMMSSFQAGLARGRMEDPAEPGRVDDAPAGGPGRTDAEGAESGRTDADAALDGSEQSGAQAPGSGRGGRGGRRRRADGGVDDDATEGT